MQQTVQRPPSAPRDPEPRPFAEELDRNITTLVEMRKQADQRKGRQERIADAITAFAGSMPFVYLHALLFGAWIAINLGLFPLVQPFDPSFVGLAMVASVEAIFLSTFVLISQNRMQANADKRAELDLQISLLAEHEVTQVVRMLDAIAERLDVPVAKDRRIQQSKQEVDPAAVMATIEQRNGE